VGNKLRNSFNADYDFDEDSDANTMTNYGSRYRNKSREGKILNLFTIVKFANAGCNSSSTNQAGICYPYANCILKSGTTDGTCALGKNILSIGNFPRNIFPII
jgi:hypothetical protein